MKIQDGHVIPILIGAKNKPKLFLIVSNNYKREHFTSIVQMVLEILSGNENSRWPPDGHIRFSIRSKVELDLWLRYSNKGAKCRINWSNAS